MNTALAILAASTAASLLASQGNWENGVLAVVAVLAITWIKLRVVVVGFIGVGGGWRTGLSLMFAILLGILTAAYALGGPPA